MKAGHGFGFGCGCGYGARNRLGGGMGRRGLTLADLPIGASATIVKVLPQMNGRKKFADVGLVPGTELVMEAHAPFGGLLRVKVMETSMALHRDDAANIVLDSESEKPDQSGK